MTHLLFALLTAAPQLTFQRNHTVVTGGNSKTVGRLTEEPVGWFVGFVPLTVVDTRSLTSGTGLTGAAQLITQHFVAGAPAQKPQLCGQASMAAAEPADTLDVLVDLSTTLLDIYVVDESSLGFAGWGGCMNHVRKTTTADAQPVVEVPFGARGVTKLDIFLDTKTTTSNLGGAPAITSKPAGGAKAIFELWRDSNADGKINSGDTLLLTRGHSTGYSDSLSTTLSFKLPANTSNFVAKLSFSSDASHSFLSTIPNLAHGDDLRQWNTTSLRLLPR